MTKLSTDEARQARRGKPVLAVLIAALILAGILALVLHPYEQGAGTIDNSASISETTGSS